MSAFPCSDGSYVLFGHDLEGDNSTIVNYLATQNATYTYWVDELGTLSQSDDKAE